MIKRTFDQVYNLLLYQIQASHFDQILKAAEELGEFKFIKRGVTAIVDASSMGCQFYVSPSFTVSKKSNASNLENRVAASLLRSSNATRLTKPIPVMIRKRAGLRRRSTEV